MIIGTDGMQNIEWNISERHSANNIMLVQGKSGTGKTTFNCFCINGVSSEGIPSIIFDDSDSYRNATEIFPEDKLYYFNVEKEGLGINPFKRQKSYIDNNSTEEDMETLGYRVSDVIAQGLGLSKSQRLKLQKNIFKLIDEDGDAASIPLLYLSVEGTELGEVLRCISKPKLYSNKINWKEMLEPGKIIVIQLSDVEEARRALFAEMLLMDLWAETQKGMLGEYLLCIDESQHFRLDKNATLHKMLRESRKYSVAMILSTQFVGGIKDRDVRLVIEQAAQKVYFRPPESSIPAIARNIDYETCFKWRQILNGLQTFEYVFSGNGIVDGKAYDLKCKLGLPISKIF